MQGGGLGERQGTCPPGPLANTRPPAVPGRLWGPGEASCTQPIPKGVQTGAGLPARERMENQEQRARSSDRPPGRGRSGLIAAGNRDSGTVDF